MVDYQVELPELALEQLATYLDLLLRWNRRINLTGLREPRQIVRRLFGESLYLSRVLELKGWLVDVGSGAGFPGLALKLVVPELRITLVERRKKKCAFLKEVVRACRFSPTDVENEEFETWAKGFSSGQGADCVTTRAVDTTRGMLKGVARVLGPEGRAVFFTSIKLVRTLRGKGEGWVWQEPIEVPKAADYVIVVGRPINNK